MTVALAVIVGCATPGADWTLTSKTVLVVGGLGYPTLDQATMAAGLGGYYGRGDDTTFVNVPWPGEMGPWQGTQSLGYSVAVGVDNLMAAIRATPGEKIVAGASGSALVINEVMRRLAADPVGPSPDATSFVVIGDPERGILAPLSGWTLPILDYTVRAIPVTPYDITVVTGEYDGFGDWPDRFNLLAMANALAGTGAIPGFGSVHLSSIFFDIGQVPTDNITTSVNAQGGVTTKYLIPTAELPLLQPLRDQGYSPATLATLTAVLRPIIDAGYRRNDPPPLTERRDPRARVSASASREVAARPHGVHRSGHRPTIRHVN